MLSHWGFTDDTLTSKSYLKAFITFLGFSSSSVRWKGALRSSLLSVVDQMSTKCRKVPLLGLGPVLSLYELPKAEVLEGVAEPREMTSECRDLSPLF